MKRTTFRFASPADLATRAGSYDAAVPGYVNPAMAIAFIMAIATGAVSVVARDQDRSTSPTVTRGR
ncbi:hypothetical protein SANTM175S_05375 [Streptomyces antimycoticus]